MPLKTRLTERLPSRIGEACGLIRSVEPAASIISAMVGEAINLLAEGPGRIIE